LPNAGSVDYSTEGATLQVSTKNSITSQNKIKAFILKWQIISIKNYVEIIIKKDISSYPLIPCGLDHIPRDSPLSASYLKLSQGITLPSWEAKRTSPRSSDQRTISS
jgi:hypothetical protein